MSDLTPEAALFFGCWRDCDCYVITARQTLGPCPCHPESLPLGFDLTPMPADTTPVEHGHLPENGAAA